MKHARIRLAYTFDHHFAVVGFRLVSERKDGPPPNRQMCLHAPPTGEARVSAHRHLREVIPP